jgi:uncharacterized protein YycO
MTNTYVPRPGDYFLTQIKGLGGFFIRVAQLLTGDASRYTHAGILLDDGTIIEAQPGGARIVPLSEVGGDMPLAFSRFTLTDEQRAGIVASARSYEGVPYSFLDYLSLALLTFGIKPKRLRKYIHESGHMICSQLVDKAYLVNGVHLFDDGRLSGDVTPGDLAHVGTIYHAYTGPYFDN